MNENVVVQPWAERIGFLVGGVSLGGLAWWATHDLTSVFAYSSIIVCYYTLFESWTSFRRGKLASGSRSLRFSIGQMLALSGVVAVYLAILRAVLAAYPIRDYSILLILSTVGFFVYLMFGFVAYMAWVSVKNIRAILRRERPRHESRVGDREVSLGRPLKG